MLGELVYKDALGYEPATGGPFRWYVPSSVTSPTVVPPKFMVTADVTPADKTIPIDVVTSDRLVAWTTKFFAEKYVSGASVNVAPESLVTTDMPAGRGVYAHDIGPTDV